MSAAAADYLSSSTSTATIQATASNSSPADGGPGSTAKRNLFGRKKSSINLSSAVGGGGAGGGSPSSTTLASESSAGPAGNDSVESLVAAGGGGGGGAGTGTSAGDEGTSVLKKGVKNVWYKRKPRVENSSPRGSIEAAPGSVVSGDQAQQAVVDDDGEGSLRASDESDPPT